MSKRDLSKMMEREMLHSEHAAQCVMEARRRDGARNGQADIQRAIAEERRMWRLLVDPDAHTYNGQCPDVSDWDRRDPDCPGCAALGDWRAAE